MRTLREGLMIIAVAGATLLTLIWLGNSDDYVKMPLKELYPNRVHGPIAKYKLAVPADFVPLDSSLSLSGPDSNDVTMFTWGAEGALVDGNYEDCVFLVGYHPGIFAMDNGQFYNSHGRLTNESFEMIGMTDLEITQGYFSRNKRKVLKTVAPAMFVKGKLHDEPVHHVYIHSPEDSAVLMIWVLGGEPEKNLLHGQALAESLNFLDAE